MVATVDRLAQRHHSSRWSALLHEAFTRGCQTPVRPLLTAAFRRSEPGGVVFIVGCYNSGTTLVKDLMRAHPDVCGLPVEGDLLTDELGTLEDGGYPRGLYANAETVVAAERRRRFDRDTLLSDWRPWIRSDSTFVEKSIANSVRIPGLMAAFPEARLIWVLRDPFEVVEGIRRRSRPATGEPYSEEFLLRQWLYINETIRTDARGWQIRPMTYGDLLRDPETVVADLFDFIGRGASLERTRNGLRVGARTVAIRASRDGAAAGAPLEDFARWAAQVRQRLAELSNPERGSPGGVS